MSELSIEIGKHLKNARKEKGMTLKDLSAAVGKSISALSKYESGEIYMDIETLFSLADALGVHVDQLLYYRQQENSTQSPEDVPAFFRGLNKIYGYYFDGRTKSLVRCVFDIMADSENGAGKVMLYMNFRSFEHYRQCENVYVGYMKHFDAVTNINLTNRDMPMEQASIQILASSLPSKTKWALFNGFSSRPMMPIALKMLLASAPLKENEELMKQLMIDKEDIRRLKLYNMLAVT